MPVLKLRRCQSSHHWRHRRCKSRRQCHHCNHACAVGTGCPHDHVIGAIGGSHEWRSAPAGTDAPARGDGGRTSGSDAESGERAGSGAKDDESARACPVGGGCPNDSASGNIRLRYGAD